MNEGLVICKVFKDFIQVALIDLQAILLFDDIVLNKISLFDPNQLI